MGAKSNQRVALTKQLIYQAALCGISVLAKEEKEHTADFHPGAV